MKTYLTLILSFVLCSGCTHTNAEKRFSKRYHFDQEESCMNPLKNLERPTAYKVLDDSKQALGTGLSYIVTGASYTSEFIIGIGAGLGLGVIVCSPLMAAEVAMQSSFNASAQCVGQIGGHIYQILPKGIGEATYKATEGLRCPEVDHISLAMRKVATCYHSQNQSQKAKEQLAILREDYILKKCRSKQESIEVQQLSQVITQAM